MALCMFDLGIKDFYETELLLYGLVGIAWAVQLEPDPGSVGQRLLPPGSEPAELGAL